MSADEEEDETFFAGAGAAAVPAGPPRADVGGAAPAPSYDDKSGKVIDFSTARSRAQELMRAACRRNLITLGLLIVALLVLIGWRRNDGNAA